MQTCDLLAINILEISLLGISAGLIAVVGASIAAWAWMLITHCLIYALVCRGQALRWVMGGVALLTMLLMVAVSCDSIYARGVTKNAGYLVHKKMVPSKRPFFYDMCCYDCSNHHL